MKILVFENDYHWYIIVYHLNAIKLLVSKALQNTMLTLRIKILICSIRIESYLSEKFVFKGPYLNIRNTYNILICNNGGYK